MELTSEEYAVLRQRLERMQRGDTLVFRRGDPLLESLGGVLYPLFEEEVVTDETIELQRYHPADSFFALILLKHLESF